MQLHFDGNLLSIYDLFFWYFGYFIEISAYWSACINCNIKFITIIVVSCIAQRKIILAPHISIHIERQTCFKIAAKLKYSFC